MTPDDRAPESESPAAGEQVQIDNATGAEVSAGQTIGEYLRCAREQAGLSIQAVAKELCMPLTRVKALENDDFACLNSDTFVRGYLRAYAKLLDVDQAELLIRYQQQVGSTGELPGECEPISSGEGNRPIWKLILGVAVILLVLWILSVWFLGNRSEPEMAQVPTLIPPATDYSANEAASRALMAQNQDSLADELHGSAADRGADNGEVVLDTTEVIEQAPALSFDTLFFEFSGECWLEVSDSLGDVLYTNLLQAGASLTLEGKAPFQVKVGNAQVVSITLNDEPVVLNITPATRLITLTVGE